MQNSFLAIFSFLQMDYEVLGGSSGQRRYLYRLSVDLSVPCEVYPHQDMDEQYVLKVRQHPPEHHCIRQWLHLKMLFRFAVVGKSYHALSRRLKCFVAISLLILRIARKHSLKKYI